RSSPANGRVRAGLIRGRRNRTAPYRHPGVHPAPSSVGHGRTRGGTMAANWIAPGRSFAPASPRAAVDPSGADGSSTRVVPPIVLVVDDNADLRDLVSVKLYRAGYDVKTASNGWEALQAAENWLPDLIVLDIMMPGLSGLEVCRKLRASR